MSPTQLNRIADQLIVLLKEMRSCTSKTLGSVSGGPYDNRFMPYPWQPSRAFSSLFSYFPEGPDVPVHLTHGDLVPHNILVDGSTITAVIDWETAGYYPEFWEYCRMHHPDWMTPHWAHVLERVFPGPRREKEIWAVSDILRYLHINNPLFG
ncbi:kinase-like domain-containing protein [Ganoderma leucocontextum]|nr:kinase-like domain-containing protein [Ganoderma leucocontextum]